MVINDCKRIKSRILLEMKESISYPFLKKVLQLLDYQIMEMIYQMNV